MTQMSLKQRQLLCGTTIATLTHTHSIKCALKKHLASEQGRGRQGVLWGIAQVGGEANILCHCLSLLLLVLLCARGSA